MVVKCQIYLERVAGDAIPARLTTFAVALPAKSEQRSLLTTVFD
jgi:hypothetical protein